jgi:hypothetical protein
MTRLHLTDLYDRGLEDFGRLSPLEKDVFVIHDLDIYYEMEGGFEDYVLSGGNEPQLAWLSETLGRIQDGESAALIGELRRLGEADRGTMSSRCDHFVTLRERRWGLLLDYLRRQGAELEE